MIIFGITAFVFLRAESVAPGMTMCENVTVEKNNVELKVYVFSSAPVHFVRYKLKQKDDCLYITLYCRLGNRGKSFDNPINIPIKTENIKKIYLRGDEKDDPICLIWTKEDIAVMDK